MNRLVLLVLICFVGFSQPVFAQVPPAYSDQKAPGGRLVTPWELLATVLGLALVMRLFGVQKKSPKKPVPTLAAQLMEAVGTLHTTADGRLYGSQLLEQRGDRKIYGSVWVEDTSAIRNQEAEKYRRKLRIVWLFHLLCILLLAWLVWR
jgi:hypothetical protein